MTAAALLVQIPLCIGAPLCRAMFGIGSASRIELVFLISGRVCSGSKPEILVLSTTRQLNLHNRT